MTITFVSSTVSANTAAGTATPVTYPASIAAGDGILVMVGAKPFSCSIDTPPGYLALGEFTNGSTAQGVDTGSTKAAAFFKTAAGSETGTLTVTSSANTAWVVVCRYTKDPAASWQTGIASGSDATASTTWSVAYGSNPGITVGDYLILAGVTPTDIAVTWSAFTATATGATLSTPVQRQSPRVSTGNQCGGSLANSFCSAGTASAALTWAATLSVSTNQTGTGVLVRLRELLPALRVPGPYLVRREAVRRQNRW